MGNNSNKVTDLILQSDNIAEFWRDLPRRLAKAMMYIKDNELDMTIYQIHDQIVIEGKDVHKTSKHLQRVMEIINMGRRIKQL